MSHVYPIARGGAPLLTRVPPGSCCWARHLTWHGVGRLVAAGRRRICCLSHRRRAVGAHVDPRGVRYALLTALTICAYTLVDGVGARHVRELDILHRRAVRRHAPWPCWAICCGGADARRLAEMLTPLESGRARRRMQVVSYGIAIWAMTVAPIALVAALRETSVLFGTLIAVFLS